MLHEHEGPSPDTKFTCPKLNNSRDLMKVTVKTVSKEEHAIELPASATVGDLKKEACEKMSTAAGCLTLVHLGTVLSDDCKTLAEHNIAEGALLVAVIKVRICSASVRVRVWWGWW